MRYHAKPFTMLSLRLLLCRGASEYILCVHDTSVVSCAGKGAKHASAVLAEVVKASFLPFMLTVLFVVPALPSFWWSLTIRPSWTTSPDPSRSRTLGLPRTTTEGAGVANNETAFIAPRRNCSHTCSGRDASFHVWSAHDERSWRFLGSCCVFS